jgi:post-segregation antitoxin (ccd killing protein)
MAQLAVRIPDDLQQRMRQLDANWSAVVREAIEARLAKEERARLISAWLDAPHAGEGTPAGTAVASIRADRDA